jgi:hypothetical protein
VSVRTGSAEICMISTLLGADQLVEWPGHPGDLT